MNRENERLFNNSQIIFNLILSLLTFSFVYYLNLFSISNAKSVTDQYILLGILLVPTWYILFKIINLQSSQKIKAFSVIFTEYTLMMVIGILILYIYIFIFNLNNVNRFSIIIFGVANLFFIFLAKVIIDSYTKQLLIKGKNNKNVIIIADESSIPLIEKIISEKYWGLTIFGIYSNSESIILKYADYFQIINNEENLYDTIESQIIDEVIYCKDEINKEQIKKLIYSCGEIGITLQLQSEIFSTIASKTHLNYFGDIPIISFEVTSSDYFALKIKSVIEYFISILAVIFFSPFYLIISLLIKSESKGSILFRQERIGFHGRKFIMYKFRTMVNNAEDLKKDLLILNEADGPVFKIKKDPRVTRIGAFLRKTSLDEFPQFFNVIQGHMAIVGPRPPLSEEVALYERYQLRRLSMKPGITCIWQTSERNNSTFEEWIKLDLQYIDNWSLKLDFILILKTINTVFKRTGY